MSFPKNAGHSRRIYRMLRRRDGSMCQLCQEPIDFALGGADTPPDPFAPSIDHFVPRSAGGSNRLPNLRLTHVRCNSERGSADWLPSDPSDPSDPEVPAPGEPVPPDQVKRWKQAIAEHNKQQRNRRGRRPPKPITGVRARPL